MIDGRRKADANSILSTRSTTQPFYPFSQHDWRISPMMIEVKLSLTLCIHGTDESDGIHSATDAEYQLLYPSWPPIEMQMMFSLAV